MSGFRVRADPLRRRAPRRRRRRLAAGDPAARSRDCRRRRRSCSGSALFAAAPWLAGSAFHDPGLEIAPPLRRPVAPAHGHLGAALSATQGFLTMRYFAGVGLLLSARGPGGDHRRPSWPPVRGCTAVMAALRGHPTLGAVLALAALRFLVGKKQTAPRYQVAGVSSASPW